MKSSIKVGGEVAHPSFLQEKVMIIIVIAIIVVVIVVFTSVWNGGK